MRRDRRDRLIAAMLARDHGICAWCKGDLIAAKASHDAEADLTKKNLIADRWGVSKSRRPHRWWDMDHIVPLAHGGTYEMANLRTLCLTCHRSRGGAGSAAPDPNSRRTIQRQWWFNNAARIHALPKEYLAYQYDYGID